VLSGPLLAHWNILLVVVLLSIYIWQIAVLLHRAWVVVLVGGAVHVLRLVCDLFSGTKVESSVALQK
jgi:hypothetical protein